MQSESFNIAIVGGGPRATYAVERLSADVARVGSGLGLHVHVYEQTGDFGAGRIHSPRQSKTNLLNRTCGQISFAADESVTGAGTLRPVPERPSLYEWCQRRYEHTQDPDCRLEHNGWPKRYVNGLALREMFERFCAELAHVPDVTVSLHAEEVVDIVPREQGRLAVVSTSGTHCVADQVLLVTGHSRNAPPDDSAAKAYAAFAARTEARYVPLQYPFEPLLHPGNSGPDRSVGLDGMGLAAIDHILFLTEGRGGRFGGVDDRLTYIRRGLEPASIHAVSESGMFPHARPVNYKEEGGQIREHRGVFLTNAAIDRLRWSRRHHRDGRHADDGLDFEGHLMPLIVLEMACLHYATLFGSRAAVMLARVCGAEYHRFLSQPDAHDAATWTAALIAPIERVIEAIAAGLGDVIDGRTSLARAAASRRWGPHLGEMLQRWLTVVLGSEAAQTTMGAIVGTASASSHRGRLTTSPWDLELDPRGNRFDLALALDPLGRTTYSSPAHYLQLRLQAMRRDLRWAQQGNVDNPYKAAADGVWRDLRGVIHYAVDNGGLRAASYSRFERRYFRYHNKLANGPGALAIEKLCALIECGILDIAFGPGGRVACHPPAGTFLLTGSTGHRVPVQSLFESRVHAFHASRDVGRLYPNLLRRGLVRMWRHRDRHGCDLAPGFLDLNENCHPLRAGERADERITVLGPAAAGTNFFQFSLFRPDRNHVVMREITTWAAQMWRAYDAKSTRVARTPTQRSAACGRP